ncbi:MAG: hypothetical protein QN141_01070 [Armatimonadota bacterium]|nr:hypothetical protein [Armatimonadota bacterium]MDR7450927.1 hypothetical protein [Armatimonadota bacterium]MDR7465849.1 hypothetical protein [Armatimonadota bacterium]MDR7493757.1 hypothetical protein [Armatimonadota bacterium]MDR7498363.1 hypothetical protein [Armatimonadota bacterium]
MAGRARGWLDEVLYFGLAALFYAAPRLLYEIRIAEADATTFAPSTLIVANHKRDLDSVVLTATLYWLQRPPRRPLEFAGREDMFLRGFLARYDVVPVWLRRALYKIDLARVMQGLRIHPVRRFPERTMEEALREALEVLGDRPAAEILADTVWDDLARVGMSLRPASLRLSHLLTWRWRAHWQGPASLAAFREPWRTVLRDRQRQVVLAQMDRLADVLRRGGVLYLAPEGVISPDGRLQPFRSGLRLVLARVPEARVLPCCIVYDFMKPGRLRIFITVGRAMAPGADPGAQEEIRRRLARLHTMTATQICSHVVWERLVRGQSALAEAALVDETAGLAAALTALGLPVDRQVLQHPQARVRQWIAFAVRRGLGVVRNGVFYVAGNQVLSQPASHWGNPVRYAANELRSVRALLIEEAED